MTIFKCGQQCKFFLIAAPNSCKDIFYTTIPISKYLQVGILVLCLFSVREGPDAMSGSNLAGMRMTAVAKRMRQTGRREKPGGNISMQLAKVRPVRHDGWCLADRESVCWRSAADHDVAVRPPAHPGMHDRAAGNE
jgi:hypothetical protein